ncbi:MAG: MBL fold metallo-hydrolase [Chloroflexota bacterium]
MLIKRLVVGELQVNCYLVACERTREALIVDPGDEAERILAAVRALELHVGAVVLTHYHFDHVLAAPALCAATQAPLCIHESEVELLKEPPALFRFLLPQGSASMAADRALRGGDVLPVGDLAVEVLHTPGHSPGGIALLAREAKAVLSGDALFREGIGRSDFPGSSPPTLLRSIRDVLLALPDDTRVYPGHGPETTIGHEKRHNPWVGAGA